MKKPLADISRATLYQWIREREAARDAARQDGDENTAAVHERMIALYRLRLAKLAEERKESHEHPGDSHCM